MQSPEINIFSFVISIGYGLQCKFCSHFATLARFGSLQFGGATSMMKIGFVSHYFVCGGPFFSRGAHLSLDDATGACLN